MNIVCKTEIFCNAYQNVVSVRSKIANETHGQQHRYGK